MKTKKTTKPKPIAPPAMIPAQGIQMGLPTQMIGENPPIKSEGSLLQRAAKFRGLLA